MGSKYFWRSLATSFEMLKLLETFYVGELSSFLPHKVSYVTFSKLFNRVTMYN